MKEISGETKREIIGKLRFHRLRIAELLEPFDNDTKNFLLMMSTLDGDGAPCVYDSEDVTDKINNSVQGEIQ